MPVRQLKNSKVPADKIERFARFRLRRICVDSDLSPGSSPAFKLTLNYGHACFTPVNSPLETENCFSTCRKPSHLLDVARNTQQCCKDRQAVEIKLISWQNFRAGVGLKSRRRTHFMLTRYRSLKFLSPVLVVACILGARASANENAVQATEEVKTVQEAKETVREDRQKLQDQRRQRHADREKLRSDRKTKRALRAGPRK